MSLHRRGVEGLRRGQRLDEGGGVGREGRRRIRRRRRIVDPAFTVSG